MRLSCQEPQVGRSKDRSYTATVVLTGEEPGPNTYIFGRSARALLGFGWEQ